MLPKRSDFPFWLSAVATALLVFVGPPRHGGGRSANRLRPVNRERPFGEPLSSEEPRDLELRRAHEPDRGRHATHPLQIPWKGWYDILWRTYREMNSDRLLSIAGGVSFFVLLAIFPAITALVSAYGLFFNASTITNNLSLLNEVVPGNVLGIVHEQASRIASNSGGALSIGIVVGILVSLWSAMSGVKAMIDALNVIYEQKECRSFLKLNLVALVFTFAGFAAFLLAIATIVVLPLILSPIGDADRALAAAPGRPAHRSRRPLPLRTRSPEGALGMGHRRQRVRGSDVDHRVVPLLLVSRQLRQLQRHLRFAGRRRRPDDLAVDFDDRGAARRRTQRRDRASDRTRFNHRRREAARSARRGDGRHRRRPTNVASNFRDWRNGTYD